MFELVPGLAEKDHVINLKLCTVLLEDNALYPWVVLVPRIDNAKNMTNLCMEDRLQLMREIDLCEEVMSENFFHDQTNVSAICNECQQLHIDIQCRKKNDPDWPAPVSKAHSQPYAPEAKEEMIAKIKKAVMIKQTDPKYFQNTHKPDYSTLS